MRCVSSRLQTRFPTSNEVRADTYSNCRLPPCWLLSVTVCVSLSSCAPARYRGSHCCGPRHPSRYIGIFYCGYCHCSIPSRTPPALPNDITSIYPRPRKGICLRHSHDSGSGTDLAGPLVRHTAGCRGKRQRRKGEREARQDQASAISRPRPALPGIARNPTRHVTARRSIFPSHHHPPPISRSLSGCL